MMCPVCGKADYPYNFVSLYVPEPLCPRCHQWALALLGGFTFIRHGRASMSR